MGADISRRRPRGRQLSTEEFKANPRLWCEDSSEVLAFARVMVEADTFPSQFELLSYFEKPWNWTEERDAWILAGEPDSFDPSEDA